MKQSTFIPSAKSRLEHGGSLLLGRRRKRRPLSTLRSLHLVLRSDFAYGSRNLLRHRALIDRVLRKSAKRFAVRVYEVGLCSNHIHLSIKGRRRIGIQNFFRVVAGHIAQEILRDSPIKAGEKPRRGGAPNGGGRPAREKDNKFWQTRVYTRVVAWGRDFRAVRNYVIQNGLEALGVIPYKPRRAVPLENTS